MPRILVLMPLLACASFSTVERTEWRRVYAEDEVRRTTDARTEIISRAKYDAELIAGTRRLYEPPPGVVQPWLHESPSLTLNVNQMLEFRVDEKSEVEMLINGDAVELYWTPTLKKDEWQGDEGVVVKQSALLVRGVAPGKAVLRLLSNAATQDLVITVR